MNHYRPINNIVIKDIMSLISLRLFAMEDA